MNLIVARAILLEDRRDQNRPRLRWLPARLYRSFAQARRVVSG